MFVKLRAAISFLTIFPTGGWDQLADGDSARIAGYFPVAGWIIGGVLAGIAYVSAQISLPPSLIAVMVVGVSAWLSRGLHLDGVADFFDGVGGGADPEARLKIMKDSAIGVFGAVGLILLLLFKIVCLTAILAQLTPMKYLLIAAVPALCRWSMASLAWKATYPRSKGTGHAFVGKVTGSDLILGGIFLLPALVVGVSAYVLFLFSLMPSVWLRRKSKVALGGVTGDVLGASCEMGEAAGWLGALLCLFWIL